MRQLIGIKKPVVDASQRVMNAFLPDLPLLALDVADVIDDAAQQLMAVIGEGVAVPDQLPKTIDEHQHVAGAVFRQRREL